MKQLFVLLLLGNLLAVIVAEMKPVPPRAGIRVSTRSNNITDFGGLKSSSLSQNHIMINLSNHRDLYATQPAVEKSPKMANVHWAMNPLGHSQSAQAPVHATSSQSKGGDSLTSATAGMVRRRLHLILGPRPDPEWTSDENPKTMRQRAVMSDSHSPVNHDSDLFRAAKQLNITLKDRSGAASLPLVDGQMEAFHEWLVEKATCEMDYVWEDLGEHFFPRYIKRGVCVDKQETSCSWPPGMKCRSSGSKALQVLHYVCEAEAKMEMQKRRMLESSQLPAVANQSMRQRRDLWWESGRRVSRETMEQQQHSDVMPIERTRRQRAVRKLIDRTTVHMGDGRVCYWDKQSYIISDSCTCSCG